VQHTICFVVDKFNFCKIQWMTHWGLCREGHSIQCMLSFRVEVYPTLILCNPLPVTRNFIHSVMVGFKGTDLTIYGSNFFVLLSPVLTPPSTQNLQPSLAWILYWVVNCHHIVHSFSHEVDMSFILKGTKYSEPYHSILSNSVGTPEKLQVTWVSPTGTYQT